MARLIVFTPSALDLDSSLESIEVTKYGRQQTPTVSTAGRFCGQGSLQTLNEVAVGSRQ